MLTKCCSSNFLPRTPPAFQQARRRALLCTVLPGRAAIFGHEENNGFHPFGEETDGHEEPTSQLLTFLEGEAIEEIRNILEWRGAVSGGDHQAGSLGFSGRDFHARGCFLLDFPAVGLVAAVDLGSGFVGSAVFLLAVTLDCLCTSVTG